MIIKLPENFIIKNIILNENDIFKNGNIEIDDCISNEIQQLWKYGIHTLGCCCGHNKEKGFIQVERTDFKKMIDLGYKWYHDYPKKFGGKNRFDAFIPKSKCKCKNTKTNID